MAILTANTSGAMSGHFTVPAGVVAGTKLVEFIGSGGSKGEASYSGSNVRVQRTFQRIYSRWFVGIDPIAQTFTMSETRQVSGIKLWFATKGASDVIVQLRATDVGFPNQQILAESRVAPNSILTNGSPTTILFENLPTLSAGVEYAMTIMCDDADASLSVAQLGKWDSANSKWVTSQPYQIGVLLSSSNASTWTAHQDMDLAFQILTPYFTETTTTVDLGTHSATNATDLMVLADVDVPSAAARCEFRMTLIANSNQQITVAANQTVTLTTAYTGNIKLEAILTGSVTATPVLYPDVQLAIGNVAETATYITRSFSANSGTNVLVVYDAVLPGSSSVAVEIYNGSAWSTVAFDSSSVIEDSWVERIHKATGFSGTTAQLRLTLTGNAAARPVVRNLRCTLT